jgi:hypothetical protein
MSFPRSGNLQETSLPEVLEHLRKTRVTGTLTVNSNELAKTVYVKEGNIVFATSTGIHDRLGEILVKTGKLKREHLEQALKLSSKSAGLKKLGAVLVENGFVAPRDLFNGLKTQVKDIIFSLFLLNEGSFAFDERLPSDLIQLQINFEELITDIINRMKQEA